MNVEELRNLCLSVPGATESLPFDDVTLVYKIMGKMFALIPLDSESCSIALKCDPEEAVILREQYEAVIPASHFNKKYWNTLLLNQDLPDKEVPAWIEHSVNEVLKKMSLVKQQEYLRTNNG